MGMEAVFFARINNDKFNELSASSDLEFIWAPEFESNSQKSPEIFAHVLHDHYTPPDFMSNGAFKTGTNYSKVQAKYKIKAWLNYFDKYLKSYKTRNILVLWGDDFAH